MTWAAYGPLERRASQSAYVFLKTTTPFLPLPVIDFTSSQPVRLMTLNFGLMKTCHVALRSFMVTGLPSDHFALLEYSTATVSGFFFVIFGFDAKRRGSKSAFWLRIWPPYQMLFSTRVVA